MTTAMVIKPASEKTLKFLNNLITDRDIEGFQASLPEDWQTLWSDVVSGFASCVHEGWEPDQLNMWLELEELPVLAQSDASKFIDALKQRAYKPKGAEPGKKIATEDGIYKMGNTIYKIRHSQTGKQWAYELKVSEPDCGGCANGEPCGAGCTADVSFDWVGTVAKAGITADSKLTYEEAKAFGHLYGVCIYGHPLSNEISIELGIGPVCGEKQFGDSFRIMVVHAKLALGKKLSKAEADLIDSLSADG